MVLREPCHVPDVVASARKLGLSSIREELPVVVVMLASDHGSSVEE